MRKNSQVLGVVGSIERFQKTLHIAVSTRDFGTVTLVIPKGQCPSYLLQENREVGVQGISTRTNAFTARKIVDPRQMKEIKNTGGKGFFNIPQIKPTLAFVH